MDDEAASRLRELLKPSWDAVSCGSGFDLAKSFKDVLTHRVQSGGVFWVDTGYFGAPTKLLDAMELFALLAHADLSLWKEDFKKMCSHVPSRLATLIDDLSPTSVGFRVHMEDGYRDEEEFTHQNRRGDMAPTAFRDVRNILLSMAESHGVCITEVPVHVTRWNQSLANGSSKLLHVALMQQQYHQSTGCVYKGLRIRSALISSHGGRLPDLPHLLNVAGAVECGITIESCGVVPPSRESPAAFVKAMQTVFATVSGRTGIQRAEITRELPDSLAFASIYSALYASKSVSSVVINPCLSCVGRDERPRLWSWIAWALFRRDPRHAQQIQDLVLHANYLKVADIDAMKAILEAPDPVALLLSRDVSVQSTTLSSQRFTLLDPTKSDKKPSTADVYQTAQSLNGLSVLDRNGQWWSVLLPGWGRAWVHQDDIVMHDTEEVREASVQWIPQLALVEMTFGSCNGALSLVELVGAKLQHLKISNYVSQGGEYPLDDWLLCALAMCSSLECLELRTVHLDSLQVLFDAFTSEKCRLRRLVLIDVVVADLKISLESLFSVLGDTSHPLARSLDELVCRMPLYEALGAAVPTVVEMLEQNKRLRLLDIEATHTSRVSESVDGPIIRFDKEELTCRDHYLQLAFLSVIPGRDDRGDERMTARGVLDSSVLELIFEFAAGMTARTVVVESWRG